MRAFLLSGHSLLIAAIFTAYTASMAGLFAYIIRTGRHREITRDDEQSGDGDRGGDAEMAAA